MKTKELPDGAIDATAKLSDDIIDLINEMRDGFVDREVNYAIITGALLTALHVIIDFYIIEGKKLGQATKLCNLLINRFKEGKH